MAWKITDTKPLPELGGDIVYDAILKSFFFFLRNIFFFATLHDVYHFCARYSGHILFSCMVVSTYDFCAN